MKRTMESEVRQAHGQKYYNWVWWARPRMKCAGSEAASVQGDLQRSGPLLNLPSPRSQSWLFSTGQSCDSWARRWMNRVGWRERRLQRGTIRSKCKEVRSRLCVRLYCHLLFPWAAVSAFQAIPCKSQARVALGPLGLLMCSRILCWELPTQTTSTNLVTWQWGCWRSKCCIWKEKLIIQIKWEDSGLRQ